MTRTHQLSPPRCAKLKKRSLYRLPPLKLIIRITCEFIVSWNTCAVPAKLPRTVEGTPSWVIARSIAALASESDFPVGRLNEMVEAADNP